MVINMYPAHILESGEIQTVREHCRSTAELLAFASGAHHGLFDCIGVHQDSGFFHRQTKEGIGYEESVQNDLKECVDAATLDSLFQQSVQEITAVIERITQLTAQESDEEANREITFHIGLLARLRYPPSLKETAGTPLNLWMESSSPHSRRICVPSGPNS